MILTIDASTMLAMKDKTVQAYDLSNNRIYIYSDSGADTIQFPKDVLNRTRKEGDIFFSFGKRDAISYYYHDKGFSVVMIAAAFDEGGKAKARSAFLYIIIQFRRRNFDCFCSDLWSGKSTLLRAIGGVVEADHGAIVFDGRDITHLPPDEIGRLGVAQVPGGEGIFPNLRVEDNLRVAAWQGRRRGEHDADMIDEALTTFPTLASRRDERAANLSGGQQQMLALAMATITRPKLFLIDELSLGLSPIVVEQLLGAIESMRQAGTAILLVEQSMNVAVAVADRVYVMETGVVRFSGRPRSWRPIPSSCGPSTSRRPPSRSPPRRPQLSGTTVAAGPRSRSPGSH